MVVIGITHKPGELSPQDVNYCGNNHSSLSF